MAANLNDFKTPKKDCILSKSNFSSAEVHRMKHRIRWENKTFDDMGTLSISFILASMNGSLDVARILVENGADVNKVDKIRKSSLMVRFIGKQKMP